MAQYSASKDKYEGQWEFVELFSGDDDPKIKQDIAAFTKAVESFAQKWQSRQDYLSDPKILQNALEEYSQLEKDFGEPSAYYYYWLRSTQEQDNPKIKASLNEIDDIYRLGVNKIQFFELNIAKVDAGQQQKFLNDPGLQDYHSFLRRLFATGQYHLSEREEQLLLLTSPFAVGNWVKMTQEFLSKETVSIQSPESKDIEEISFNELMKMTYDSDQQTRDEAVAKFNILLRKHLDTGEVELNSVLGYKKTTDRLRGYDRPDKARHLADDIGTNVVDVMLDSVANNFDIARRYYTLKAQLLDKQQLQYHERNVPIGEVEIQYSYAQALGLVKEVFADLDPEFEQIVTRLAQNGQIDVFPRKGKAGGAFCAHGRINHPVYVLLNFQGKLDDVLTMAHEFGHAINDEFMKAGLADRPLDFGTSLATAEVASTFMEDFVLQRLLQDTTPKQRLVILMHKLNSDISTIFRQVACYRFEQELHQAYQEQNYLSKDKIGQIFAKHMYSYMGDSVEQSAGSQNWWLYWTHIRRYFYVYSYASGLLISKSLQAQVHADHKFITKVKEFLAAGFSASPQEIFSSLGIDISDAKFWQQGIGEISVLLEEVEQLVESGQMN